MALKVQYSEPSSPSSLLIRTNTEGSSYHALMDFEPSQRIGMYGPLLVEQALIDVPIFGPQKADFQTAIDKTLQSSPDVEDLEVRRPLNSDVDAQTVQGLDIATSLRAMREGLRGSGKRETTSATPDGLPNDLAKASIFDDGPKSCRQLHENLLSVLPHAKELHPKAQVEIDLAMLLRAKQRYLFDPAVNRSVVADDLWVKYLWDWIAGMFTSSAEMAGILQG